MQATQQSQLIDQRTNQSAPKDFEADAGGGDLEGMELGLQEFINYYYIILWQKKKRKKQ